MTTCRGCWGDDLRNTETVLVSSGADSYVCHPARPDCAITDQPHRMTECGAFAPPDRSVSPSIELAPCPPLPPAWEAHVRAIRASYYLEPDSSVPAMTPA
jgi:hypothetical protein